MTWSADEMWLLVAGSCAWLPASLCSAASFSSGLRAHHELHPPPNQYCRDRGCDPENVFVRIDQTQIAESVQHHDSTRKLLCENSFTPECCTLPNWFCENTAELNSDDCGETCNATWRPLFQLQTELLRLHLVQQQPHQLDLEPNYCTL